MVNRDLRISYEKICDWDCGRRRADRLRARGRLGGKISSEGTSAVAGL